MPDSVDASEQMVANWTRQVQEAATRYQAMAARMEGQVVTERSRDNLIEVTVNSKGLVTNIAIAEAASGKRMAEVSSQIMRLIQKAQSRIPELLQQAMAETVGTADNTANSVIAQAQSTFPAPPPEEDPTPPEPERHLRFGPEDEEEPPARPPAPPQPKPIPRRRRTSDDDDDDDDEGFDGRILR
ncbi:YbaB/EbfC family nucleoid-associated protein [Amycolatopsis suaedae]|uniref:YbaB/EbfC family DNA-binding protein n=1 Tax=Amycolatopsis suaedae TaxID=2510978 RepID=A0A4Q7J9G9_9PSEU|nr:YbaB/EbfC family nucleoid-associated protein [Amycolatopsis suaedae]RZQ63542.1 YbaB/EbfC family DNA-binding protein [Amycolatopsis suaedae]